MKKKTMPQLYKKQVLSSTKMGGFKKMNIYKDNFILF